MKTLWIRPVRHANSRQTRETIEILNLGGYTHLRFYCHKPECQFVFGVFKAHYFNLTAREY